MLIKRYGMTYNGETVFKARKEDIKNPDLILGEPSVKEAYADRSHLYIVTGNSDAVTEQFEDTDLAIHGGEQDTVGFRAGD